MFKNKVAFITGGSAGLGFAIVNDFIQNGANVFFTYRNERDTVRKLIDSYENKVHGFIADASDFEQAKMSVEECIKVFGHIDVLVNNAANAKDSSLLKSTYENFDYTVKNVLYPVYNYCKTIVPLFVEQERGKIINIGSINGMRGREGSIAYSTAKAGIEGLTKTMAKELGKYTINCNVVAPGFIDTDGQQNTSELIKKLVLDECAIRRLSAPSDIVNMVLFLASEQADNITGQVFKVDCGQYI